MGTRIPVEGLAQMTFMSVFTPDEAPALKKTLDGSEGYPSLRSMKVATLLRMPGAPWLWL